MVSIFAGNILASFLLAEPILGAFKNSNQLLLATAVWYKTYLTKIDLLNNLNAFLFTGISCFIRHSI
jgi:hypothetical protein